MPPGEYLVGYTRGNYGQLGDLPERMVHYANTHGIEIVGPVYTFYPHDGICTVSPSDYLAQVNIKILDNRRLSERKRK